MIVYLNHWYAVVRSRDLLFVSCKRENVFICIYVYVYMDMYIFIRMYMYVCIWLYSICVFDNVVYVCI